MNQAGAVPVFALTRFVIREIAFELAAAVKADVPHACSSSRVSFHSYLFFAHTVFLYTVSTNFICYVSCTRSFAWSLPNSSQLL